MLTCAFKGLAACDEFLLAAAGVAVTRVVVSYHFADGGWRSFLSRAHTQRKPEQVPLGTTATDRPGS